jgi:hypothetical protein
MLYCILFSIFACIFISVMFPNQYTNLCINCKCAYYICIKYIIDPLLCNGDYNGDYNGELIKPFSNTLIVIGYNCIYLYSCLQIKCYKISTIALPYITRLTAALRRRYDWNNDDKLSIIHFYHNNVINAEALIEINNNIDAFNVMPPLTYDYIICMDRTHVSPINIVCYNQVPNNLLYELSNVRFLSIKMVCNDKLYNIILNTDNYNYYIINNIIDEQFFKYYLTHVLKETISFENFKYCLEILDNDINIHSLNETHKIIIKKDTYEINSPHSHNTVK